jgi:hypothetical protein
MAKQKISELPAAGTITGAEKVIVNQNSITKLTDLDDVKDFVLNNGVSGTFANPTSITVTNGIITAIS